MGIYERDYDRSYDTGSGWNDGPGGRRPAGIGDWSANSKLLAVMVAVYVVQAFAGRAFTELFALQGDWFVQPWRAYGLVTYSLLHSTQIWHLLFNGLALFFFGRTIEQRLGGKEYVAFFFAAAAFAGLCWSLVELASGAVGEGQRAPILLGASGGIAGVLILFALLYPHVQVHLMGILPVPAWLMAILFLAQDISGALQRSGDVAYTAHLGGALFGYLYFRYGWRLRDWLPDWSGGNPVEGLASLTKRKPKLRVHRDDDEDEPERDPIEDRVDEILRKIQSHGQASLTREEQRILERASRQYQQRRR